MRRFAIALTILIPAVAGAEVVHFEAGSIILPLDACYARSLGGPGNNSDVDFVISPSTQSVLGCEANGEKDDGALATYGLVMRLVYNGVPVSWVIKPSKTSWHEVDFEIRPGSNVRKMNYFTGA